MCSIAGTFIAAGKIADLSSPGESLGASTTDSVSNYLEQANEKLWVNHVEVQRRSVLAWVAFAEGQKEEALRLMRSAAELEESTDKPPVTPGSIVPARELFAEMLLAVNRSDDALIAFEATLHDIPNRFQSLYGAALAAERAGKTTKARHYYTKVLEVSEAAKTERPELRLARNFLKS